MFVISIQGETSLEARTKLLELADLMRAGTQAQPPVEAPATDAAIAQVVAELTKPARPAPVEDSPAVPAAPPATPAPPKAKSADELRAEIRAVLSPHMTGPKKDTIKAWVAEHGGSVTAMPADSLTALLDQAKEIVA